MIDMGMALSAFGVRRRHPGASEREIFLRRAALHLDRETMLRVYGWRPDLGTEP